MNFPKGTSSILIKKHGLTNVQVQAIVKHISYAQQHYKDDKFIYAWWEKTEDYYLDSWRITDNCGRIFLWTAYDNFNMGRFIVKLLGDSLANEVWVDAWHSLYAFDESDKYFNLAKLTASTQYEV